MEGQRRSVRRTLHRTHVVTRLEAQLWALAYEQLRSPAVAKPTSAPPAARPRSARPAPAAFARGA